MFNKFLILFLMCNVAQANLSSNFFKLARKSRFTLVSSERAVLVKELNLEILNCSNFPYYGESNDGVHNITSNLTEIFQSLGHFFSIHDEIIDIPNYVFNKFKVLETILNDKSLKKTFKCTYGDTNSFFALSNTSSKDSVIKSYSMPPFPSILFDINRIAGNFPLNVNVQKFTEFYGNLLNGISIIGGTRNPLVFRIPDSKSIVFHEMMHWSGSEHFDENYADIIYLSEFCLFSSFNMPEKASSESCSLLLNKNLWQKNNKLRSDYIKKNKVRERVRRLKDLYYSKS